ncbi:MAG: hypothetical protein ACJAWV_000199 [Flammeovirgaceae bacterium]|jgi:hypothetical protein
MIYCHFFGILFFYTLRTIKIQFTFKTTKMILKNYKLAILALIFFGFAQKANAQEKKSLGNFNGVEISYMIQYLSTDEKKNASKSKDKYQLTTYATNQSGADLFCNGATVGGVKVANAKSLTKTARASAIQSRFKNADGTQLFKLLAGATVQNSSKITVPKGATPVVSYEAGCNFQTLDKFQILVDNAIVNGTWRREKGAGNMTLTYILASDIVQQQGSDGNTVVWYRVGPNTFQRTLRGATSGVREEVSDENQVYSAKIVFVGMDKIMYTNSDGISVTFLKNK